MKPGDYSAMHSVTFNKTHRNISDSPTGTTVQMAGFVLVWCSARSGQDGSGGDVHVGQRAAAASGGGGAGAAEAGVGDGIREGAAAALGLGSGVQASGS